MGTKTTPYICYGGRRVNCEGKSTISRKRVVSPARINMPGAVGRAFAVAAVLLVGGDLEAAQAHGGALGHLAAAAWSLR